MKSSSISNWETGINSVDIDTLHSVCKILDVSINDMFGIFANQNDISISNDENYNNSDEENNIILDFRELNEEGRTALIAYLDFLSQSDQYKKCDFAKLDKKQA